MNKEIINRTKNVNIPLMRRNGITIHDIEVEIIYREKHKDELCQCENDYLRLYFTEELIWCKRLWMEVE